MRRNAPLSNRGWPIESAAGLLPRRLPTSLELISVAAGLAVLAGIVLVVTAARRRGTWTDAGLSGLLAGGLSIPVFVLGTVMVLVFGVLLRWVPVGGYVAFTQDPVGYLRQLALPAVTLALAIRAAVPELLLSVSSEILPEMREFERMNTTVLNAYVQPAVGRYVRRLAGRLEEGGIPGRLQVMRELGGRLQLAPEEIADGIMRVVNAGMTRAIRVMTVERGIDPRRFTLVAFGGAGPLHASDLARSLGIKDILIPVAPGNFSALGLLAAPVREDRVRAFRGRADTLDCAALEAVFAALSREAVRMLREDGFPPERIRCERSADLRYVGQAYELTVPLSGEAATAEMWRAAVTAYHRAHERAYGFSPAPPLLRGR